MYDFHVHSIYSHYCKYSMDKMIEAAINKRIKALYFVDLFEIAGNMNLYFEFDILEYWKEVKKYNFKYKDKIDILCGLELGISKEDIEEAKQKIDNQPLDMIMLALHRVGNKFFNNGEFFRNRRPSSIYEDYYKEMINILDNFDNFDILGHIGILESYKHNIFKDFKFEDNSNLIYEVLERLVKMNKGLEINTSILRFNEEYINTQFKILKMFNKLGGEIVTIGSDAHTPDQIGFEYKKAVQVLKNAGFENVCFFRKRLPNFVKV